MGFGLHSKNSEDWANIKFKNMGQLLGLKVTYSKLYRLIQKHRCKINSMKFKNLRYPGLYVLLKGSWRSRMTVCSEPPFNIERGLFWINLVF
jgi:hypothetical protein